MLSTGEINFKQSALEFDTWMRGNSVAESIWSRLDRTFNGGSVIEQVAASGAVGVTTAIASVPVAAAVMTAPATTALAGFATLLFACGAKTGFIDDRVPEIDAGFDGAVSDADDDDDHDEEVSNDADISEGGDADSDSDTFTPPTSGDCGVIDDTTPWIIVRQGGPLFHEAIAQRERGINPDTDEPYGPDTNVIIYVEPLPFTLPWWESGHSVPEDVAIPECTPVLGAGGLESRLLLQNEARVEILSHENTAYLSGIGVFIVAPSVENGFFIIESSAELWNVSGSMDIVDSQVMVHGGEDLNIVFHNSSRGIIQDLVGFAPNEMPGELLGYTTLSSVYAFDSSYMEITTSIIGCISLSSEGEGRVRGSTIGNINCHRVEAIGNVWVGGIVMYGDSRLDAGTPDDPGNNSIITLVTQERQPGEPPGPCMLEPWIYNGSSQPAHVWGNSFSTHRNRFCLEFPLEVCEDIASPEPTSMYGNVDIGDVRCEE